MSQPVFSEKQIREFARDEVRRIIDAGLMYTFEADQQISGVKPAGFKTASEAPVKSEPKEPLNFNPNVCNWAPHEGAKGPYELSKDGTNFVFLKQYLGEQPNQSATINGVFYWLFKDGNAVGRKQKGGV